MTQEEVMDLAEEPTPGWPKGFRAIRRRDSRPNRENIKMLRKRIDHLAERVEENADVPGPDWDAQELRALRWAMKVLPEWMADDPVFDYDWTGTDFTDTASLEDTLALLGTLGNYKGRDVEIVGITRATPEGSRPIIRLQLRYVEEGDTTRHVRVVPGHKALGLYDLGNE